MGFGLPAGRGMGSIFRGEWVSHQVHSLCKVVSTVVALCFVPVCLGSSMLLQHVLIPDQEYMEVWSSCSEDCIPLLLSPYN